jgi:regulator of protease activity HflC (stomatin/prohibitin superfamily)
VKVTRVELRDIIPSQAVREAMELQMSAERRKRASILTSEGDRESAVNSARGKADAQILDAEAQQKSVIMRAEAEQKSIILRAQAERQQQVLKAQAIAESAEIIAQRIKANPDAEKALEVLFALGYLDMGTTIGKSDSSKVMFMDPRTIPATLEGIRAIVSDSNGDSQPLFPKN